MTLPKRLANLERMRKFNSSSKPVPQSLAEKLADALTSGGEALHIRDVLDTLIIE